MPPRARQPAATPEDDFAPGGSTVTRRGRNKPDTLPGPGRRNQASPTPVPPTVHGPPDEDALSALREAAAERVASVQGGLAGRLTALRDGDEGETVAVPAGYGYVDGLSATMVSSDEVGSPQPEGAYATALDALMYGLRLRLMGASAETGSWEEWDEMAQAALLAVQPADPMLNLSPAARFLWGSTGLMRMPDAPDISDIADIVALGRENGED